MAYPGYQAAPPDPMWGYFSAVAGADGQIDADELQRCLTSSGISGNYQRKPKITYASSTLTTLHFFCFFFFCSFQ